MAPKVTIQDMRQLATERGGRCLSDTYVNDKTKLWWECKAGHRWEAAPHTIKRGHWCPCCTGHRQTIGDMRQLAAERGGRCLSEEFLGAKTKLLWECRCGHQWQAWPNNIKSGSWCPICAAARKGKRIRTIKDMQAMAQERGGACLSKAYINRTAPLHWQCGEGHQWEATPSLILRGSWCPVCAAVSKGGHQRSLGKMQRLAAKRGGRCLSETYVTSRFRLTWECSKGHRWEETPQRIQAGSWCPQCQGAQEK